MKDVARKRSLPQTTYSRKPHPVHTPKRRRLNDDPMPAASDSSEPSLRSSPAPPEALVAPDTPASSPPPPSSPLPPPPKKSQFNFFTRASATTTATTATTSSSSSNRRRPIRASSPRTRNPVPKPKSKLTQMTIDLGQTLQTTCRACGMSYHPSTPDDDALHKRFHAKSVGGVDFALKPPKSHEVWRGGGGVGVGVGVGDSHVLVVGRSATLAEKRKAKEVLQVVDSELGAAEIGEADLWADGGDRGDRFKVYLYIRARKCIGLCLAERIKKAYRVLDERLPRGKGCSSSVSVSDTAQPALLGVSRIWTCSSHRRQGIAARLLDCARDTFIYGMHLEKSMVAFSQPTESGGCLARSWFCADLRPGEEEEKVGETKERWAVYVEEA